MFSCCCPKPSKPKQNQIDEKLIVSQNSPKRLNNQFYKSALSQSQRKKQSQNLSQKSSPLQKMQRSLYEHNSLQNPNSKTDSSNGINPNLDQLNQVQKGSKLSGCKSKGQLFQYQGGTQVLYFDLSKDQQLCIKYSIEKKTSSQLGKSSLNYILSKQANPSQLILIIPSHTIYQSKHLYIPNNINVIFTNTKRSKKNYQNYIQIIEDQQCMSIQLKRFDRIIIMLEQLNDYQTIINYLHKLLTNFSITDITKIQYVFPAFLGLQQLTNIIKHSIRTFVINQKIKNISHFLDYQIDLVKQVNIEPFFIVKSRKFHNIEEPNYQAEIFLSMGLLMTQLTDNIIKHYKYFLQHILSQMKLLDYLKYKSLVQNEKQNYFKKLINYKLISEQSAKLFQMNKKLIQYKYELSNHRRLIFKQWPKRKIISKFGFSQLNYQPQSITNQIKQQQWNDDLKFDDLKIRKCSFDKNQDDQLPDLNLIDQNQDPYDIQVQQFDINIEENFYSINSKIGNSPRKTTKKIKPRKSQLTQEIQLFHSQNKNRRS